MISAKEVNDYIAESGLSDRTISRTINVTPKRFAEYKAEGIHLAKDVQAFQLMRKNHESKLNFDIKDMLKFQERMGYRDHDMCLIFGVNKDSWSKMKRGAQEPLPTFRKLFKVADKLEKDGFDVLKTIGFS